MRVKAILLALATAAALSACGTETPVATPDTTSNPGATTGAPAGGGDRDSCLMGTWKVDVNNIAQQTASMIGSGAVGTGAGTLTVAFGSEMKVTYGNTVSMDMKIGDKTMNMKSTFAGDATSTNWKTKDGKLTGTMSSNNVTNSAVATVGGVTVPTPTSVPFSALNLSETVNYTCSGSNATISGSGVSWKLTKA
ncbi:hypothetical protein [Rhizocola hellebori]|nr:hypothetical protein [Rhizocola hellebori]